MKEQDARLKYYLRKFSDNVRNRRIKLNLTQEQFAERVGCHVNHARKLEGGLKEISNPTLKTMIKVAEALSTSVNELFPF